MDHACTVFVDTYSSIDQPVRRLSPAAVSQQTNTQDRSANEAAHSWLVQPVMRVDRQGAKSRSAPQPR
jgi:hypothetical protein